MDLALIFKQTESNTMNGGIAPSFIKETTRTVKVIKVVFVGLASPKLHVSNLKIAPEMARRIPLSLSIRLWSTNIISDPANSTVLMNVSWVLGQELDRFRPQRRKGLWVVVKVDRKPVCLVVVVHVAEDVVVDIAEEVHIWLHTPVVADILEGWMLVEETAIPSTHLVV